MARTEVPKKKCYICGQPKPISKGFYKSKSPMFHEDGSVHICVECVKNESLNSDGTVNPNLLLEMCKKIDKPFYLDDLYSAFEECKQQYPHTPDDDILKKGKQILGYYFKNIMLMQTRDKLFADSKEEDYFHNSRYKKVDDINRIKKVFPLIANKKYKTMNEINEQLLDGFDVTDEIRSLFGYGYSDVEYRKMYNKYETLKLNYTLQTNLHQEALATYVRFKVKEEDATAAGNVDEAKKWYDVAQNAAEKAKLTPKQLTQADLQGGINSFSEIFKAVEQAVDVVPILPQFKFRPNDALDFVIWCYINYARELQGLPQCSYEDVYKFYDKKKQEYLDQYGDHYGIFDEDTTESNRESIKKFITLPKDYVDGDDA